MSLSLGSTSTRVVSGVVLGEHEGKRRVTMLSALSRGYSTWNGDLDVYGEAPEKTVIHIDDNHLRNSV